ncbi:MAG: UDP-N-acetylmuramate:L-alanyl-gamma-D-glutamyl-meso-diaminopimelate ligase [Gammaproteobacteria bacterium]|nr:UDP-N-acetylmuramate:L-alanyl-gamma-D-glutamyl-meso-diaminopimelate ligase [Gammaproteobacteria bacterium]NND61250.1 UDP-N-acetylmuramate:L-alanyl-gamma-D-glutamyl-meso-diaminopimelate ligase [Gammaproteobacteria bacterium]
MRVNILGICGTFMGGIASLAREAGHAVRGADSNVYPPMSTQLERLGIPLHDGLGADALEGDSDVVVVGNVMSRGNAAVEHMLDHGLRYQSGPQWLYENVLHDRHVLAVAGTHGKTSTASMLASILEAAGLQPGFLIGGVPIDFNCSARLGASRYFVVEADEYDTAFFDKRSKFVHYHPRTLVVTNLEFDHADIFDDMAAIRRQFHHLVRTVPGQGRIIAHAGSDEFDRVLDQGCWTPVERYGETKTDWQVGQNGDQLVVRHDDQEYTHRFGWPGRHNRLNALAAIAAAHHVGVSVEQSLAALGDWQGVRRRLDKQGTVNDITIYDDFAHHPTEIAATLEALRAAIGKQRLVAVFEPRSNSMKAGVHSDTLGAAFGQADLAFVLEPPGFSWDLRAAVADAPIKIEVLTDLAQLESRLCTVLRPGDHCVNMSNGSFDGLPQRLLTLLA